MTPIKDKEIDGLEKENFLLLLIVSGEIGCQTFHTTELTIYRFHLSVTLFLTIPIGIVFDLQPKEKNSS